MLPNEVLDLTEHVGKAAIFKVQGPEEVPTNRFGIRTAIKCDVIVLDPGKDVETFSNVLIFNSVPVGQLKPYAGQEIVAAIELYDTKAGGQAPKLVEPPAAAIAAAEQYRLSR